MNLGVDIIAGYLMSSYKKKRKKHERLVKFHEGDPFSHKAAV